MTGYSRFVKSSFIKAVSYDGSRVRVLLTNGAEYHYPDVPTQTARAFLSQPDASVGQWYNNNIKGRYAVSKVRGVAGI